MDHPTRIPFESKQISKDLSQTLYNVTINISKVNITLNFVESILCNAVIVCALIILLLIYWNIKMWLTHKNKEDDFVRRKIEERMFDVKKRKKQTHFVESKPPPYSPGSKIDEKIGLIDSEHV